MAENGQVHPLTAPGSEGVTIQLDQPRQFTLDLGVIYAAERLYERLGNLPFLTANILLPFVTRQMNGSTLLMVLTCGLQVHDPALTMEQVGRLVTMGRLTDTLTKMYEAWELSSEPQGHDAAAADDPNADGSSGSTSGAAPATTSDSLTSSSGA